MFKKAFSIFAVSAFVLGAMPQANMVENLVNACSYICCDHNGDMWSN